VRDDLSRGESEARETLVGAGLCVGVVVLVNAGLALLISVSGARSPHAAGPPILRLEFASVAANIVAIAFAFRRGFRWPELISFRREDWTAVARVSLGCVALTVPVLLIAAQVSDPFDPLLGPHAGSARYSLARALVGITVGPVSEEIIFRGIIMKALLQRTLPAIAIAASAAIFAVFHVSVAHMPAAFTLGLAVGYSYYFTRSLVPGMVGHAAWNLVVFAMSGFGDLLPKSGFTTAVVSIVCLGVSVLMLWPLSRATASVGRRRRAALSQKTRA